VENGSGFHQQHFPQAYPRLRYTLILGNLLVRLALGKIRDNISTSIIQLAHEFVPIHIPGPKGSRIIMFISQQIPACSFIIITDQFS